jgi:two-component sensor histidine kinase
MRDIVARCLKGETVRCDLPYATGRGELRWVDFQAAPIVAPDGTVTAIVPSGVDITERKNSEQHIRLLMLEINHRAKNMLGLVSAIARQTAAASPTEFVTRFAERIQSLSANHDLLVHSEWKGIDIAEVVRVQLAPFADLIGKRISVAGPSLTLRAQAAQSIGMALHELSTNAGKYGALSSAKGHVDISWSLEEGELQIGWVESGGPYVEKPARRGFGTTVLTSLAQMSVGGKVELIYDPAGLVWRLACPADKALEGGETQATAQKPGMAASPPTRPKSSDVPAR